MTLPIETMRQEFEDWARHAAGLDTAKRHSASPLDRPQYERSNTALAWDAWIAAGYGARRYSLCDHCWGPGQFVVVATFRYCLGRQTYIVQECADWLTLHWPVIEQPVRNLIQRELEAAFVKDDAIRAAAGPGTGYKPLGWDSDRREWERVRSLWANVGAKLPAEAVGRSRST